MIEKNCTTCKHSHLKLEGDEFFGVRWCKIHNTVFMGESLCGLWNVELPPNE